MFSRTVKYEDYDEKQQTATLWFHLSKKRATAEPKKTATLLAQLEETRKIFEGDEHTFSDEETLSLVHLVDNLAELTFGERSADGRRFKQNDELWLDFYETPAYDEFIFGLFDPDPMELFRFVSAVMPSGIRAEAEEQIRVADPEGYKLYQGALKTGSGSEAEVTFEATIDEVKDKVEPTVAQDAESLRSDLSELSREELERLLAAKS